jgi:hypothetical protein
VDFQLPTPVSLGVGYYWLGLHSGDTHVVARFAWAARANSRLYNADAFADGASSPFGGQRTRDNEEISIHAFGEFTSSGAN